MGSMYKHLLSQGSPAEASAEVHRQLAVAAAASAPAPAAEAVAAPAVSEDEAPQIPPRPAVGGAAIVGGSGATGLHPAPEPAPAQRGLFSLLLLPLFRIDRRVSEGALSSVEFKRVLAAALRDGAVSSRAEEAFEANCGVDAFTGASRALLEGLARDYDATVDELGADAEHAAFVRRTDRSLIEVDHFIDVQLWVRAVELVNKRLVPGGGGGGSSSDAHMIPAPGVTFAALHYCSAVANAAQNLNATTWRVNAVGKGKLIVKFMDRRWDYTEEARNGGTFTAAAVALECTPTVISVLNARLASGKCVRERIGAAMRAALRSFIAPALLNPPGFWRPEEREYLSALLSVLAHMCLCLWPDEDAGDESCEEEPESLQPAALESQLSQSLRSALSGGLS
jgi:hypothetical protein